MEIWIFALALVVVGGITIATIDVLIRLARIHDRLELLQAHLDRLERDLLDLRGALWLLRLRLHRLLHRAPRFPTS